jgi:ribonuclease HI
MNNTQVLYVFSDGNCKSNGQKGAKAGYSAFFTDQVSSPLCQFNKTSVIVGPTNNKAELSAIRYILHIILDNPTLFQDKQVVICTDSMYSIRCIETWSHNWIKNGWKTASKQPVKNKELIQDILNIKKSIPSPVSFRHVRAHQPEPADKETLEWKLWYGNFRVDADINHLLAT